MESKAACWIAIWSGKTLENKASGSTTFLDEENNPKLKNKNREVMPLDSSSFHHSYKNWEIQVKKDWREGLNGKRTLCEVWDNTNGYSNREITAYQKGNQYPFVDDDDAEWKHCRRLTKSEIQEFMDNAPEFADED